MNNLNGMKIIVSRFVEDKPKLHFDATFLGGPTVAINEFNKWLGERFGTVPYFLVMGNSAIITSPRGLEAIKEVTKSHG